MTLIFLDGLLVILLLFGIKAVKEFFEKYKEFISLKNDLNGILRHVQFSMKTAQTTINTLQNTIKFAAEHITPHLPQATTLQDDLHFLIEQGEKVADRLESITRDAKQHYVKPHALNLSPTTGYVPPSSPACEESNPKPAVETPYHHGFFTQIKRIQK